MTPEPRGDELAYLVATFAWKEGLTANEITKRIYGNRESKYEMRVKRAMKRAHGTFLRLVPPTNLRLQHELDERVNDRRNQKIRFHVAPDDLGPGGPVFVKAAELVGEIFLDAARTRKRHERLFPRDDSDRLLWQPDDVVTCNAGGRTISEMVKAMCRNPPVIAKREEEAAPLRERLLFAAVNAAHDAWKFNRSANFLSVTMAELMLARHLAFPHVADDDFRRQHRQMVENASLLICGAGTCGADTSQGLMAQHFKRMKWPMPIEAVGDLAFNLLDADGSEVEVTHPEAREYVRQLNPTLNLSRLMQIASSSRVVVVLDAENPESKCRIGAAVMKRNYATDIVLGTRLAQAILKIL